MREFTFCSRSKDVTLTGACYAAWQTGSAQRNSAMLHGPIVRKEYQP